MTAKECITGRRSIRQYTDQPVSHELLAQIVETASYAPSLEAYTNRSLYRCGRRKEKQNWQHVLPPSRVMARSWRTLPWSLQ